MRREHKVVELADYSIDQVLLTNEIFQYSPVEWLNNWNWIEMFLFDRDCWYLIEEDSNRCSNLVDENNLMFL